MHRSKPDSDTNLSLSLKLSLRYVQFMGMFPGSKRERAKHVIDLPYPVERPRPKGKHFDHSGPIIRTQIIYDYKTTSSNYKFEVQSWHQKNGEAGITHQIFRSRLPLGSARRTAMIQRWKV